MASNATDLTALNESASGTYCKQGLQGSNFILVAYVCPVLVLFGIPANILTICVLNSDSKRNTARYLMLILATQDFILLILYTIYYIVPLLYGRHRWFSSIIRFVWSADSPILFLLGWFKFSEAYTIVTICVDRYVALRHPFKSASICTVSNAKRVQVAIVLAGFFEKLPLLILDFCYYDWMTQCGSCEPIFRNQSWYNMFWLVYVQLIDQIVTFLIPLLCLLLVNVYLIWKLQHVKILKGFDTKTARVRLASNEASTELPSQTADSQSLYVKSSKNLISGPNASEFHNLQLRQRRRTHQARNISAMLVCVISVFIVCETPTALYFFRDLHDMIWATGEDRVPMHSLYAIAIFTAILNFASNFLIYGLVGRRFRWLLNQTLSRWTYACLHCKRRRPERLEMHKRTLDVYG